MSSTLTAAAAKAKPGIPPAPSSSRKRRVLWMVSGLLALVLAGMLALAFTVTADDAGSGTPGSSASSTTAAASPASMAGAAAPLAASGELVVDRLPGPPPREIAGQAVDADGNSLNPDLTGPGDDSAYLKDDDKDADSNDKPKAGAPR